MNPQPLAIVGTFHCVMGSLHIAEHWARKKQKETEVKVAEICMLRWTCGYTRNDKINQLEMHI